MLFKDHDKKTEQKMEEHIELIISNNKRINDLKGTINDDTSLKLSYFEKKISNNITSQEF